MNDKNNLLKSIEQAKDEIEIRKVLIRNEILPKDIDAILIEYKKARKIQDVTNYIDKNFEQIEKGIIICKNM